MYLILLEPMQNFLGMYYLFDSKLLMHLVWHLLQFYFPLGEKSEEQIKLDSLFRSEKTDFDDPSILISGKKLPLKNKELDWLSSIAFEKK